MSKAEQAEYHGKTLKYWKKNAKEDYIKVPISVLKYITLLEQMTSQPLNLDVKVDDDWQPLDVPVNYDKFANKNKFKLNEKSFKPEWIAECKEYQQAKTVRQKIVELTDKLERRDKHIVTLEELRDVLTQERDFWKIGSFDDKIKAVEKERDELRETYKKVKQNQLSLITRLEAEKQKNEKLEIIISKCKTHILEHTFYNITKDLNK